MKKDECCPKFNPKPWDEKTHKWKKKKFIMGTIPQVFHMPLPFMFGRVVSKLWKMAEDAKAAPPLKDFLMLAYDPSPWKSELYISVTKKVPGAKNVELSGTYMTKVFDGPFSDIRKWLKEFEEYLAGKKKKAKKLYFYYTTCPKCAVKYGHNYVVAFAQV